jgi:hypothetical protein
MVQITSGVLGAVAATLAFGAVHLEVAAGNDLLGPRGLVSSQDSFQGASQTTAQSTHDPIAASVNRTAKSDRESSPAASESMTLSFSLAGVPATSIMMRVPVKAAAAPSQKVDNSQAKNTTPSGGRMVACEPSVSVLTQAARQLQASRCVT